MSGALQVGFIDQCEDVNVRILRGLSVCRIVIRVITGGAMLSIAKIFSYLCTYLYI